MEFLQNEIFKFRQIHNLFLLLFVFYGSISNNSLTHFSSFFEEPILNIYDKINNQRQIQNNNYLGNNISYKQSYSGHFFNHNGRKMEIQTQPEKVMSALPNCTAYSRCFDCLSNPECSWCKNDNKCHYYQSIDNNCVTKINYINNPGSESKWFYNYYYICPRLEKCGPIEYNLNKKINYIIDIKINVEMIQNEGCYWKLSNKDQDEYEIYLRREGGLIDKISFLNFENISESSISIIYDKEIPLTMDISESLSSKVVFYKYINVKKGDPDFEISIRIVYKKMSVSSIIIIICSIGSGVVVLLVGFIFIYRGCIRNIQNSNNNELVDRNDNPVSYKIDDVLKNFKSIQIDECYHTEQNSCPICLLLYKEKEEITKLLCHHIFHSDCIKNWILTLIQKNKKPTCPNCNYDLLNCNEYRKEFQRNENTSIDLIHNVKIHEFKDEQYPEEKKKKRNENENENENKDEDEDEEKEEEKENENDGEIIHNLDSINVHIAFAKGNQLLKKK